MEDFFELGLEGADKLIDKHFDKVPDKYCDPHTYNIRERRRRHKDSLGARHEDPALEEQHAGDGVVYGHRGHDRRHKGGYDEDWAEGQRERQGERDDLDRPDDAYQRDRGDQESNYDPRVRDNYPPTQRSPPSQELMRGPKQGFEGEDEFNPNYDPRGYYNPDFPPPAGVAAGAVGAGLEDPPPRRRREGLVRRSSSQPGRGRDDYRDRDRDSDDRDRDWDRGFDRDRERRQNRRDKKEDNEMGKGNKTEKVVLTLLGAAVGGLAVSAVMGSLEDNKQKKGRRRARSSHDRGGRNYEYDREYRGERVKGGGGRR